VKAIVAEAHAHGALVRAHVFEPFLVEDIVLPAGVDVIEHLPLPILNPEEDRRVFGSDQPAALLYDTVAPGFVKMLERMARQGIVMVPTLDGGLGALFAAPKRSRVEQAVLDVSLEAVRRFRALGGILAVGNDFGGVERVAPGMPLAEMRMLLAAGLTPMEVLEAATRHAAVVCGLGDSVGSLEAGKLADIIVVSGNPLDDLAAMDKVVAVVKGGEVAFRLR
jgi:imidazolonepropionase-like amidohydrolase